MEWILAICICIIILLGTKIFIMKKTAREIRIAFTKHGKLDTNTWIAITSRDRDMRILANELNQTLEEVRKSYRKYTQGDKEMKATITSVSHDLRTPLTAICGYLTLSKRLEMSEELHQYIDIIEERALYMKRLTEELFAYSAIRSSEEELELEQLSLNRLLEDSLMEHYGALMVKGIRPIVDITETQIIRKLNKTQMERVFSNLISNALKYSDGDLNITLSDQGVITFSNSAKNLSPVLVERIFDRFYTVETARDSTGLGLSIAKAFVEQMGGEIMARYEDGKLVIEICFS